jgi:alpha/beta superfamily hydrolase
VDGLILIAPPINLYDFNFLSPCPIKTLIVKADQDEIVKKDSIKQFYENFKKQKNAEVTMETINKSNHLFEGQLDPLMETISKYIKKNRSN